MTELNPPTESLLSANFAGRPSSDISDISFLEGFAAFLLLSSTSSSDSENDPILGAQISIKSSLHELAAVEKPSIIVTAPHGDEPSCPKDVVDTVDVCERPRLRRKALTAPPGALNLREYTPQLPRRVVSARLRSSRTTNGRHWHPEQTVQDLSGAERNFTGTKADMIKQKPCPTIRPFQTPQLYEQGINEEAKLGPQQLGSFSEKDRVKKAFGNKTLERLTAKIAYLDMRGQVTRPFSISTTPSELYAKPRRQSIGQHSIFLPREDVRVSDTSPSKAPSSRLEIKDSLGHEKATRAPRAYLPGRIHLEAHTAKPRRDSVATLYPFDKVVESKGKRFSDMVGLDNIVMYFVDFGVMEDTTDKCLDQYWLEESQGHMRSPTGSSASDNEETMPSSPWKWKNLPASRSVSKFSFSSGSSSASQPRTWATPIRQRIKFKRLLSPGLPGPASHQTPVK